jgi:hypothetical protein
VVDRRPRGAGEGVVIRERPSLVADDLCPLVSLAGDEDDVAGRGSGDGRLDGAFSGRALAGVRTAPSDGVADNGGILPTGVVVGHDDAAGTVRRWPELRDELGSTLTEVDDPGRSRRGRDA